MAKTTFKDKFQRFETKYVIGEEEYEALLEALANHMLEDDHAVSTISNLYYDTPHFQMIRESLEKPFFKEKLRMRSYDERVTESSQVFLEIKKKVRKIVYKRRISCHLMEAEAYMGGQDQVLEDSQIKQEIAWLSQRYGGVEPMMYIYYDRYSLKGKENVDVRITFDANVTYRTYDLSLTEGKGGLPLLPEGYRIMEIKVPGAYPLWLSEILDSLAIYPKSFSKYGVAYKKTMQGAMKHV